MKSEQRFLACPDGALDGAGKRGRTAGLKSPTRNIGGWGTPRGQNAAPNASEEALDVFAHLMFPEWPVVAALFAPIIEVMRESFAG